MQWLMDEGGTCRQGIGADPEIGMVPVTKLISSDGNRHVIHGAADQSEELSPLTIDYFDRRLGMVSPFRSVLRG